MTVYDIVTGKRINSYIINRRGSSLLIKCLCKVSFLPEVNIFSYTTWLLMSPDIFSSALSLYVRTVGDRQYLRWQHTWWSGTYSIVLTKGCLLHRDYLKVWRHILHLAHYLFLVGVSIFILLLLYPLWWSSCPDALLVVLVILFYINYTKEIVILMYHLVNFDIGMCTEL